MFEPSLLPATLAELLESAVGTSFLARISMGLREGTPYPVASCLVKFAVLDFKSEIDAKMC